MAPEIIKADPGGAEAARTAAIIVTHHDRITHYADRTMHITDGTIDDDGRVEAGGALWTGIERPAL